MAKIVITGDAVAITSSLTLEDIKTVAKYRPSALILKGGEDNKEDIFAIGVTEGSGNINEYGASFGRATHDEAKLAVITLMIGGEDDTDIKEFVADTLGRPVMYLNQLEAKLPEVLDEIETEKAAIMDNITVSE